MNPYNSGPPAVNPFWAINTPAQLAEAERRLAEADTKLELVTEE